MAILGFCGYSWGFPRDGASNDSRVIENMDFRAYRRYLFGTLGNEANIIIYSIIYSLRLATDPKVHDLEIMNDLEWLEWSFYVKFTLTNRH